MKNLKNYIISEDESFIVNNKEKIDKKEEELKKYLYSEGAITLEEGIYEKEIFQEGIEECWTNYYHLNNSTIRLKKTNMSCGGTKRLYAKIITKKNHTTQHELLYKQINSILHNSN